MDSRSCIVALVLTLASSAFSTFGLTLEGTFTGETYYVSKTGSNGDAKSWATAKNTIQDAVDLCVDGDTVIVDDGEYSDTTDWAYKDGSGVWQTLPTVVQIKKRIHLKARNTREAEIVGAWGANGAGAGAHRCIYANAADTLIEGFVIRNGATLGVAAGNNNFDNGGGVSGAAKTYIVDCDILDCRAGTGAAIGKSGIPIRCYFRGNAGVTGNGKTGHVFYRSSYAYNCIFERNGILDAELSTQGTIGATVQSMTMVNCTFLNNDAAYVFNPNNDNAGTSGNAVLNCAFLGHSVDSANGQIEKIQRNVNYTLYVSNCVEVATASASAISKFNNAANYAKIYVDDGSKAGVSTYQYFSPAEGDWRLVAGSDLLDAGSVAWTRLSWIPTEYQDTDFFGKPRKVGSDVDIGAVEGQGETVSPAAGFLRLTDTKVTVGGKTVASLPGRWIGFSTFPGQVRITPDFAAGTPFFGFRLSGAWDVFYRFPDRAADEGAWLTPPSAGQTIEVQAKAAASELWVDKSYAGGDSDGSPTKPYVTIQDALDHGMAYGVVRVKKGVYDTGSKYLQDHAWPARVAVDASVAIRSVDGPEETVILGDENTRCVAVRSYSYFVQVQGFTLTGGHATGADGQSSSREGGAFWVTGQTPDGFNALPLGSHLAQVTDCIISNNVAVHAGAMFGGWAQRCHFTANRMQKTGSKTRGSAIYVTYASACTFTDNWCENTDAIASVAYSMLYNTTHYREPRAVRETTKGFRAFEQYTAVFNSTVYDCALDVINKDRTGRLSCGNVGSDTSGSYLTVYPAGELFADAEGGDCRLCSDAAGLRKGDGSGTYCAMFAVGDFYGNALTYIDGNPLPGAFSRPVPVVKIPVASALRGSVSPARPLVEEGGSVTLTDPVAKTGHKLVGWFDGVQTNESTATSFTVTVPVGLRTTAFVAGPVFSTDIYVNANATDDTGDGTSPETAMRMLSAAGACAVAGDTIHAAKGDYNDGSMTQNAKIAVSEHYSPSRIVVPSGVTLASEDGPDETYITGVGEKGANGVRCVAAFAGATVRGFTLRNGATSASSGVEMDNNLGGCALAPYATSRAATAFFEDCVITNGNARNGGCVAGGYLYRCRILNGSSGAGASLAFHSVLDHSIAIGNGNTGVRDHHGIFSSTVINQGFSAKYRDFAAADDTVRFENSILICQNRDSDLGENPVHKNMKNCLWNPGNNATKIDDATCRNVVTCEVKTIAVPLADVLAAVGIDADFRPVKGCVAIDAGDNAFLAGLADPLHDIYGGQRIYNAEVDIGAAEYDWRTDYSAAIGRRGKVTACDPEVSLADGKVRIPGGKELVVAWKARSANEEILVSFAAVEGELAVFRNGEAEPVLAVTEPGDYRMGASAAGDVLFRFAVAEGGVADLKGMRSLNGIMIIVR